MLASDAAKILGLLGDYTPETVKSAYKRQAQRFHPDKGGSVEMMQAINTAYAQLKGTSGTTESTEASNYPDELNAAINALADLEGLELEVCGAWLWVTGNTKEHRATLKSCKFFYAPKKVAWFFRPADYKSRGRGKFTMEEVRERHGSQSVKAKRRKNLAA